MADVAEIKIGNYHYKRFKKYRIENDIYTAAGAFEFELFVDPAINIKAGDRAEVYVNGFLEMTGLVDRVSTVYEAAGRSIAVSGRDLMGLVVDSYVEQWFTMNNVNLINVAQRLLRNVPFINRRGIDADESARRRDAYKPVLQLSPGDRIFDVLKEAAASRGVVFYARPDGGLCFRKPKGRGAINMHIARIRGEANTFIIRGERTQDFSERYSKYTVLTQEPGEDVDDPPYINAIARLEDKGVPYYKPFVEAIEEDRDSVSRRANMILEQRRAKSDTVKYKLRGHSQGTRNWTVDELVHVVDDELEVYDDLLVYSRAFEMSRDGGITTELTLGEPGLAL